MNFCFPFFVFLECFCFPSNLTPVFLPINKSARTLVNLFTNARTGLPSVALFFPLFFYISPTPARVSLILPLYLPMSLLDLRDHFPRLFASPYKDRRAVLPHSARVHDLAISAGAFISPAWGNLSASIQPLIDTARPFLP